MISTAESVPDDSQGRVRELPGEVHGHLPRKRDVFRTPFAEHVCMADIIVLGHASLNEVDGDRLAAFFLKDFAQLILDDIQGDGLAGKRGDGGDAHEGTFESANIASDTFGEKAADVIRKFHSKDAFLFAKDGLAGFHIRRLKIRCEAPFEPGHQSLFEPLDLARWPITTQDDLLSVSVKCVEGVEELLLYAFFAGEELDIVDEEHIHQTIFASEFRQLPPLKCLNEFVGEFFAG